MEGVVQGGWEFVWAAYGITWASWVAYGVSLVVRHRKLANEEMA